MKTEQTSREKRRQRRIRNQILAYFALVVLLVAVAFAGIYGAKAVVRSMNGYAEKVNKVLEEAESNASVEAQAEAGNTGEGGQTENTDSDTYSAATTDEALDELIKSLLSDMTIEEMVAGMFIVSPESITGVETVVQAGDGTKAALSENPVGGIIYSSKNFKSADQFTQMISNTTDYSKFPLFFAVKAECGDNTDFGLVATTRASELSDSDSTRLAYESIASALAGYGINMNLAPVSDVVSEDGAEILQGRTFGSDATAAAPLVSAAVSAMSENGVNAVLQKFPSSVDTSKTAEELSNSEFVVYESAIKSGVKCIMVSNTQAGGITGDNTPACLSGAVINDTLRTSLGYSGLVITDYLNASEITSNYSSAEAALAAVEAGADMLLSPQNYSEAYNAILDAVSNGTISRERIYESMYRIYLIKYENVL